MNGACLKLEMIKGKSELRNYAQQLRKNIPAHRKTLASQTAFDELLPKLTQFSLVLSFGSFRDEIDIWQINAELALLGILCLPHHTGALFRTTIDTLVPSPKGPLEPIPKPSANVDPANIDCILVPALLFDEDGFRIGYGGGFYDKLLAKTPPSTSIWGVGYREQRSQQPLPRESHDIPVGQVLLF